MAWSEQYSNSEVVVSKIILRDFCDIDLGSMLSDRIDLNTLLKIVGDCNNLRLVTLNIYLLNILSNKSVQSLRSLINPNLTRISFNKSFKQN